METYGLEDCFDVNCPSCHPEKALAEVEDLITSQKAALTLMSFGIDYTYMQANIQLIDRVSIALYDGLRGLIKQKILLTNRLA